MNNQEDEQTEVKECNLIATPDDLNSNSSTEDDVNNSVSEPNTKQEVQTCGSVSDDKPEIQNTHSNEAKDVDVNSGVCEVTVDANSMEVDSETNKESTENASSEKSIGSPVVIELLDEESESEKEVEVEKNDKPMRIIAKVTESDQRRRFMEVAKDDENEEDVDDPDEVPALSLRIENVHSTTYEKFDPPASSDQQRSPPASDTNQDQPLSVASTSTNAAPSPDIIEIPSDDDEDEEKTMDESSPSTSQSAPTTDATKPEMLTCNLCKKQFNNDKEMYIHYYDECLKDVNDIMFACDKCKDMFKGPFSLRSHVCDSGEFPLVKRRKKVTKSFNVRHRLDKTFECKECGMVFDDFNLFGQHVLAHRKKFLCDQCGRSFAKKDYYLAHMRAHSGYSYQCEICNKGFVIQSDLVKHVRVHTGEKPYGCSYPGCLRTFTNSSSLTVHRRTHTGERPYRCEICHRSFTQNGNLKKHRCLPSVWPPEQPNYMPPHEPYPVLPAGFSTGMNQPLLSVVPSVSIGISHRTVDLCPIESNYSLPHSNVTFMPNNPTDMHNMYI